MRIIVKLTTKDNKTYWKVDTFWSLTYKLIDAKQHSLV